MVKRQTSESAGVHLNCKKQNKLQISNESQKIKKKRTKKLSNCLKHVALSDAANKKSRKAPILHSGSKPFESLSGSLTEPVMTAVRSLGFRTMRDIQAETIPALLLGRNVRGTALAGSGKTLAFLIPALNKLVKENFDPQNGVGVLIISPARELALQIHQTVEQLLDTSMELRQYFHMVMIGGNAKQQEEKRVKGGVNIIVATPGRLLHHLESTKPFLFSNLSCLVLDEADRILDMGFMKTMEKIIQLLPNKRQSMLFSATRGGEVESFTKTVMGDGYQDVDVTKNKIVKVNNNLEHEYLQCPTFLKFSALCTLLQEHRNSKVMVFFNHCKTVALYGQLLTAMNLPVMCIHGKKAQASRTTTFSEFQRESSAILLCTDVAARGWDIQHVDLILQVDPPTEMSEFVHRVGRAARQEGTSGRTILFLRPEETSYVAALQQQHGVILTEKVVRGADMRNLQTKMHELVHANTMRILLAKRCAKKYREIYASLKPRQCFNPSSVSQIQVDALFGLMCQFPPNVAKQYLKKHNLLYMKI